MIEYSGPAAVSIEYWKPDKFDGSATGRVGMTRGAMSWFFTDEVTGTMSSLAPWRR